MSKPVTIPVGVVVARERADHAWDDVRWRCVDVMLDAPIVADWRELRRGPGFVHYHAATLPLLLDPRHVTPYRVNLANGVPSVYVVVRRLLNGAPDMPIVVSSISVSPFQNDECSPAAGETVERVPMPSALVAKVEAFIGKHCGATPCAARASTRAAEWQAETPFGYDPLKPFGGAVFSGE